VYQLQLVDKPQDQFDKLGISWSYFISKIQLKPIVKSNGKVVIKVTSDQILQEPILDFLLEVSWPSGEIFKEYTVLVDPPVRDI
jgi:pilus assembly protein FimV